MCRMCDSATHAALNSPKPRACLRLTPYRPTNAASRSLHSYQPYAWLRHTPYLRTAQILKPRCSNCIFHPVGQKYQNSNQAVWIPFSVVPFSAK